ncbi:MAG: ATPase [Candidatus Micrarchaeota archaeon]|nr:ATPase [Candidatus Micrarchaeota archaeon]
MVVEIGMGLVAIGAGMAIVGGALATAWAQASIGAALMGLLAEKDDPRALLFLALPETMVILGFVVAFLIISNLGG